MDLHLDKKVTIVSGGLQGIGEGIVFALAHEGAVPVILDRQEITDEYRERLEKIVGKDGYDFYQIDLMQTEKIGPLVKQIAEKWGGIDAVVNNAGANDNKDLESTGFEEFTESLRQNLLHYYEIVHQAVPFLKESKGAIVNIGSKTAITGQGKTSAYAAAKGAILGLTREWAAALADDDIRVNTVVVAECWTPLYAEWIKTFGSEEEQKARLAVITDKIPLGKRMTTPEEIANTVVFLLSDRSSHTTGQWVHVDGGYVHLDRALS